MSLGIQDDPKLKLLEMYANFIICYSLLPYSMYREAYFLILKSNGVEDLCIRSAVKVLLEFFFPSFLGFYRNLFTFNLSNITILG